MNDLMTSTTNKATGNDLYAIHEKHHSFLRDIIPQAESYLGVAIKLEKYCVSEAKMLALHLSELKKLAGDHFARKEHLLFPLLQKNGFNLELSMTPVLRKEIKRAIAEHDRIINLIAIMDELVFRTAESKVSSYSLKTACTELSLLFIEIREQMRIERDELLPAIDRKLSVPLSDQDQNNITAMKNILVPVDYSRESENAVRYAIGIAEQSGATVTLLHLYQVPVSPSDVTVASISEDEILSSNIEIIQSQIERYRLTYPRVQFKYIVTPDVIPSGIEDVAKKEAADIVVMSVSSNDIGHLIFGHNAIRVINNTSLPVLVIPLGATFDTIQKVILAYDYKEINVDKTFAPMKKLLKTSDPELMMVHVLEAEDALPEAHEAIAALKLEQALEPLRHSFYFPVNEDTIDGINEFADEHPADFMVMVHHPRGLTKRLFSTQHTRKVIFDLNVPLLVLQG